MSRERKRTLLENTQIDFQNTEVIRNFVNPNFKSFVSFCNMSFKVAVTCRSVPLAFDLNVKCTKTCLVVAPGRKWYRISLYTYFETRFLIWMLKALNKLAWSSLR